MNFPRKVLWGNGRSVRREAGVRGRAVGGGLWAGGRGKRAGRGGVEGGGGGEGGVGGGGGVGGSYGVTSGRWHMWHVFASDQSGTLAFCARSASPHARQCSPKRHCGGGLGVSQSAPQRGPSNSHENLTRKQVE